MLDFAQDSRGYMFMHLNQLTMQVMHEMAFVSVLLDAIIEKVDSFEQWIRYNVNRIYHERCFRKTVIINLQENCNNFPLKIIVWISFRSLL